MIEIKKKVVVVTGAGKIGSKIIKFLDNEGAFVVFMDIKKPDANLALEYENAVFVKGSFANVSDIVDMIHFCKIRYGKIDALINTAFPKPYNWGKENLGKVAIALGYRSNGDC